MRSNDEQDPSNGLRTVCISGCLVLAAFVAMFALSGSFEYGSRQPRPVTVIVGILMTAAVAAFVGLGAAIKVPVQRQRQLLLVIVGLAVSMRLVALFTCPILEIDYYRYIWDGKVLAEGISPYEYSPWRRFPGKAKVTSPSSAEFTTASIRVSIRRSVSACLLRP